MSHSKRTQTSICRPHSILPLSHPQQSHVKPTISACSSGMMSTRTNVWQLLPSAARHRSWVASEDMLVPGSGALGGGDVTARDGRNKLCSRLRNTPGKGCRTTSRMRTLPFEPAVGSGCMEILAAVKVCIALQAWVDWQAGQGTNFHILHPASQIAKGMNAVTN